MGCAMDTIKKTSPIRTAEKKLEGVKPFELDPGVVDPKEADHAVEAGLPKGKALEVKGHDSEEEFDLDEDLDRRHPAEHEAEDEIESDFYANEGLRRGHVIEDEADIENILSLYLRDVRHIPLLTAEQEVDLAKRIERGDRAAKRLRGNIPDPRERSRLEETLHDGETAKRHLVQANSRLVISLAKRYLGLGVPMLDLVQEGYLGLIKAAEKFDYRMGNKFSTYATWWIRQSLARAVADQGRTIRLPVHMNDRLRRMNQAALQLEQSLGREADLDELATEMDLPASQVERMLRLPQQVVSLEQPVGEERNGELGEFIVDGNVVDPLDAISQETLQQEIRHTMDALTQREARVLELRFGLLDGRGRTLNEVAEKFGLTRERVRQIEQEALRKLRQPGRSQRLRPYLN